MGSQHGGGHESHAKGGHEEGCSAEGQEGEDEQWLDKSKPGEEQGRQGGIQSCFGGKQEEVRVKPAEEVGRRSEASPKGVEDHRLLSGRRCQRRGEEVACQSEVHLGQEVSLIFAQRRMLSSRSAESMYRFEGVTTSDSVVVV